MKRKQNNKIDALWDAFGDIFGSNCNSVEDMISSTYRKMGCSESVTSILTKCALMDDGIEDDGHPMPL